MKIECNGRNGTADRPRRSGERPFRRCPGEYIGGEDAAGIPPRGTRGQWPVCAAKILGRRSSRGVNFDGPSRLCLPVHVRSGPKATYIRRCHGITKWATSGSGCVAVSSYSSISNSCRACSISGNCGVGEKRSSAGARTACASAARPVDWSGARAQCPKASAANINHVAETPCALAAGALDFHHRCRIF
jgi:hypothetical protein